jgi:imidazolonepropionase-like amidohydrolase
MNQKISVSYISILVISLMYCSVVSAQMVGKVDNTPVILKGATLHTVTQGTYVGDVYIESGIIREVGANINVLARANSIDCTGKHIYPGFIDGGTRLGLTEVSSISVTNDYNEIGDFIPHMQALTAVNPNSVSIPVTRTNGVTTVFAAPSGGKFPGTAALIDLYGYTPEDMYAGAKGVIMSFPSSGKRGRWDRRSEEDVKKDAEKAMESLKEIWEKLATYAKIDSSARAEGVPHRRYRPDLEAMLPVYKGEASLFIEVNKKEDILNAIKWVEENKIKAVFTGVSEGYRVAEEIATAKIPVITGPVLNLPSRDYDRYDAPYTNAAKMKEAGVKVALRTSEAENVRNLPFHAGIAAANGMGKHGALRAITMTPAEIFGVADKYGSIEKGKVANLIVSSGDPFEPRTKIEQLYIRGIKIPLESRQTLLYEEFINRGAGAAGTK